MGNWRANVAAAGLAVLAGMATGATTTAPAATGVAAAPATAPAARAMIEKALREVMTVLRDTKTTREEKRAKVQAIAEVRIDFETMGRLAMGANWRDLTDAQRAEFTKEFRQHVINTYGHFTDDYTDEDLVVSADNAEARSDWTVQTKIVGLKDGAAKELAKVDYRLRQKDGSWLIIDITIEGVSMMSNFRSQFQEIMTSGGIDKLMKLLREKNAAGAGAPSGKGQ